MKKSFLALFFIFILIFSCSKKDINDIDYNNSFENYIEEYDSNEIISNSILEKLDKQQLRIVRNSIYAKHGYIFNSDDLKDYFFQFSWYNGINENVDSELTEIDLLNIQNIINYENIIKNQATDQLSNTDSSSVITQNTNLFNDLNEIAEYLKTMSTTVENPVSLKLNISLGTMTDNESNWRRLLKILDDTGKYVALDLSLCSIAGRDFNPVSNIQTGKWFIVSLLLPDDAKNIPSGNVRISTFNYFYNLNTLSGNQIISIGLYAFNDCNDLSVSFPAVNIIEDYNFANCTGLVSIHFPAVTTIGKGSFQACTNLTSISFSNVINFNENAFQNCTKLTNVNLTTLINVGESAFLDCTGLINVNFPIAETIERNAFKGCTSLSTINFPKVISIDNGAFQNCSSLTNVNFPMVNTLGNNYYDNVGVFQNCSSIISVSFPNAITLSNNIFQNCINLITVYFPLVTTIGENAFQNCSSLTKIYFPSAMQIGKLAFAGCTNLVSVNFPEARAFLHDYFYGGSAVFTGCNNLVSITFGEYYNYQFTSALPGDLFYKYNEGGAGTYTRTIGSNSWTKQ